VTAAVRAKSDAREIGAALVGWPVLSATPLRRSGNNRIYLLTGAGNAAVLKFYPRQAEDPRDRLNQEFGALSFLNAHGVEAVPRALACDQATSAAAYSWIEGSEPSPTGPSDIDALADFFIGLQDLRSRDGAAALPQASASCFSPAMVVAQVEARLARLHAAIVPATEIAGFVVSDLQPAVAAAVGRLRDGGGTRLEVSARLHRSLQALSASDFGFHNALRRPDGRLAFVDFEYFGWDDPAKAVADVMLHAGMALPDHLAQRYRVRVQAALQSSDPGFAARLDLYLPSMVVLWCLIMLNEFLPERWARRTLAGQSDARGAVQARQLQKARVLLSRKFS
jgi:Phosphotransferase enzyme family